MQLVEEGRVDLSAPIYPAISMLSLVSGTNNGTTLQVSRSVIMPTIQTLAGMVPDHTVPARDQSSILHLQQIAFYKFQPISAWSLVREPLFFSQ